MKKKRNLKPSREMKPVFLVLCEGDTEEAYINLLRQKYRLPVKVISRITGTSISANILQRYIRAERIGLDDKVTSFLMYDLDIKGIAEKMMACKDSINIASNPSVELWFLLHMKEQKAAVSTDDCIGELKKSSLDWANYKKGMFSEKQKQHLWANRSLATIRAKQLSEWENPSSSVYRLIEKLEGAV